MDDIFLFHTFILHVFKWKVALEGYFTKYPMLDKLDNLYRIF